MKKIVSFFTLIFLIIALPTYACDYTINLTDTYGDGWNDNGAIEIIVNSVIIDTITVTGSTFSYSLTVLDDDTILLNFLPGTSNDENEWELLDSYNNIVCSGVGSDTPSNPECNVIADCPIPTCFDGIQNQNETGIDCGGVCPECEPNGELCIDAIRICSGSPDTNILALGTIVPTEPDYGCVFTVNNPAWYYFQATTSGNMEIEMSFVSTMADLDHVVWGPFNSPTGACTGGLVSSKIVDCNFSVGTPNINISNVIQGEYYLILISNYSGTSGVDLILSSSVSSTAEASCDSSLVFYQLCEGDSAYLYTPYQGYSYQWSPSAYLNNDTLQNPTAKPLVTTTYYVTVTDSSGIYFDSVNVDVEPLPTIVNQPQDKNICPSEIESYLFIGTDIQSNKQWQIYQSGSFVNLLDTGIYSGTNTDTLRFITQPYINGNIYRCVVGNNCHIISQEANINFDNQNVSFTVSDTIIEINHCVDIVYTGDYSTNDVFVWDFNNGNIAYTDGPFDEAWSTTGIKEVVLLVTNEFGCVYYDTAIVSVRPTSEFTINQTTVCPLDTIFITYTGSADSLANFNWDFNGNTIISGSGIGPYAVVVNQMSTSSFSLQVEENNVMSNIYSQSFTIYDSPVVVVDTLFSVCPNELVFIQPQISGGQSPYTYLWNGIPGSSAYIDYPDSSYYINFTAIGSSSNSCGNSKNIHVNVSSPNIPKVCFVTVESDIDKNKVIWEKDISSNIVKYKIYKETSTNVYSLLGEVMYDSSNVFVDYTSSPSAHGDKYKITTIDTCGYESNISSSMYHKTINLILSVYGTTMGLHWDYYKVEDDGFIPDKYYIYRGSTPNNITLYDSISSSFNSYNDPNIYSVYYYIVGVKKDNPCIIDTGNGGIGIYVENILSNTQDNTDYFQSINNYSTNNYLNIYPNPANSFVNIESNKLNLESNTEIKLTDVTGKQIQTNVINKKGNYKINIDNLSPGTYFIIIKGKEIYRGKFVKTSININN